MKLKNEGNYRSGCPINQGLEVFGDKWTLLIIRDILMEGKSHFREFLQSEEKIASNILTDRLNHLEGHGIITREKDPSHKQRIIYQLTSKGRDLYPIMRLIGEWSVKYQPVSDDAREHMKELEAANGLFLEKLMEVFDKDPFSYK